MIFIVIVFNNLSLIVTYIRKDPASLSVSPGEIPPKVNEAQGC